MMFGISRSSTNYMSKRQRTSIPTSHPTILLSSSWKPSVRLRLYQVVALLSSWDSSDLSVNKLNKARTAFSELCKTLSLSPSSWETKHIEEAVAVAFLVCPERLVWQGQGHPGPVCFLGEPLADCSEQGYFVAVLLKSSGKGLQCTLSLPVTDWVVTWSRINLPNKTAKLRSDSTFTEFRTAWLCVM